jgi:hypothetical protein
MDDDHIAVPHCSIVAWLGTLPVLIFGAPSSLKSCADVVGLRVAHLSDDGDCLAPTLSSGLALAHTRAANEN